MKRRFADDIVLLATSDVKLGKVLKSMEKLLRYNFNYKSIKPNKTYEIEII